MYRTDRAYYIWLVDVLRQAYMEDKLEAGSPCGCGIGNIVMAAAKEEGLDEANVAQLSTIWTRMFCTNPKTIGFMHFIFPVYPRKVHRENDKLMQSTAFGVDSNGSGEYALGLIKLPTSVLMELEWEFEVTEKGETPDEIMFNRLMATIAVLDRWFGIPSITKEETKESFIKVKPSLCNARTRKMVLTT